MTFIDYTVENGIAILSWNMEGHPMNVMNEPSMTAFHAALVGAMADPAVVGLIITSGKDSFFAGADLKSLETLIAGPIDLPRQFAATMQINQLLRSYETGGKPVVAAINGHALGGGYEIALACHYRVAIDNPKTQIGLPEAKIGLFPGAGGTQRLPRLIGIEAATPLMLEGRTVAPDEALKLGMVNELVADRPALLEAATRWIRANPTAIQPWDEWNPKTGNIQPRENFRVPGGNIQSPKIAPMVTVATAMMMDKTKGNYPAQQAILQCLYEGLHLNIEQGIKIEARYFTKLLARPEPRAMIRTLFLAMGEANKGAARPKNVPPVPLRKVGILGAGFMGAGVAYVTAMAGMEVVLKDVTAEAAERGKDYSRKLFEKAISRGKSTPEKAEKTLALIKTTDSVADFADCDLVVEAVFENRDLKNTVLAETEPVLNERAIWGSNTSTLPITGLASASARPAQFIGLHFFSPVEKMQLVEIILGQQTTDEALAVAIDYTMRIRKTPIVVHDGRGFYTSRCFGTYTSEGCEMLYEGIDPLLIERAGEQAGMPVGPLDVADAVAIDLSYKVIGQAIADEGGSYAEAEASGRLPNFAKVVKTFYDLGRYGKKNGKGYYAYPEGGKKYLWEGLADLYPRAPEQPTVAALKQRLLHRQAIEAVRCLEEGVLTNPTDGDIGSILAWGFPPYTGGVFSYIDGLGVAAFVADLDQLTAQHGDRFCPTDRLRNMAQTGETFFGNQAVAVA